MDEFSFTDNPSQQRFELHRGADLAAHADYRLQGQDMTLHHTEVLKAFEGQGVGSRLAKAVFAELRQRGLRVAPTCEFMAAYLRKHPELQDLLSDEGRRIVGT